jgi:RNA ligase
VSRPYQKFFNWNQDEAELERGPFEAYDKMDGTMIVVGNYNGEPVVNTKASFGTWHTERAEKLLMGYCPPPGVTAIFELISPDNRVVLDYQGFEGLVLLGGVWNDTGEDTEQPDEFAANTGWPGEVVTRLSFDLQSMLTTIQNPEAGANREGFVVVWVKKGKPSNRIKLKFAQYLHLHAVYSNMTTKAVWESLVQGNTAILLAEAPDEFNDAILEVAGTIEADAQALIDVANNYATNAQREFDNRADAARWIQSTTTKPLTGLVWKAYDGKTVDLRVAALTLSRPETKPLEIRGATTE